MNKPVSSSNEGGASAIQNSMALNRIGGDLNYFRDLEKHFASTYTKEDYEELRRV